MIRILLWPFELLWCIASLIFRVVGSLLSAIIGLALIILGVVLTVTVVGAIIGVPIIFTGALMIIRSIF